MQILQSRLGFVHIDAIEKSTLSVNIVNWRCVYHLSMLNKNVAQCCRVDTNHITDRNYVLFGLSFNLASGIQSKTPRATPL